MEKFFAQIEKLFITTPVLDMISRGKFFTQIFAWILRIIAALLVIAFIYFSVTLWISFARGSEMGSTVGDFFVFLFAQLLAIPLFYFIINIFITRSNNISKLPLQTDYVVIPVAVQLIKMIGEVLAACAAVVGIFVTLSLLVTGGASSGLDMISGTAQGLGRMSGASFGYFAFIAGPVIGFLILVFFYSIAELIGALVDIARNTKKK
jgi:hypothetical protein